jgi:PAS domain S-box-containing protein
VLGGLFYGHEETGIFEESSEILIAAIAAQAAIAIENAGLREQLTAKIGDLQQAQAVQRSAAKHLSELAAIVESSDDAIISKDLNGIITSWNNGAERILGYASEEMIGQSILKLIPEELHSDEPVILGKIRSGERIDHFETIRLTRDGRHLEVSLTVSPVRDETGTIVGASKILRDISSQKRLERSLLQAEKIAATGRMAATIAHEINNPLEAVVNLLYLVRASVTDPEAVAYLDTAERELDRVSHIARQTLGFYRENASASPATISRLAHDAITVYEPRCIAAGITIEQQLDSTRKIVIRKGEMMQVISNLITNSIYAMPEGGTLTITTSDIELPKPGVLLTVEDSGTGIAAEDLPRIFDAFFTTRSTIGTGIGLFVAKQFVEGHGGTITATTCTEPRNHGTIMTIFLPAETTYANT